MKNILFVGLTCALVLASCKKDKLDPETPTAPTLPGVESLISLGTDTTSNNEVVTLYASSSSLKTGYNKIYASVKDLSGNIISNATVTYATLMDMGAMTHASPVEQPTYNSVISKYEGVMVFTMASTAGSWSVDVIVNGNPTTFALNIAAAQTKVVGSYLGSDGFSYIVTLVPPTTWTVGMNDVEIMIHKKESMMSFPDENDMTIIFDPQMVSMGHGSPNNISPTSIGNGHYKGKVNLTMSGDWRFNMELLKSGTQIQANAYLDILF